MPRKYTEIGSIRWSIEGEMLLRPILVDPGICIIRMEPQLLYIEDQESLKHDTKWGTKEIWRRSSKYIRVVTPVSKQIQLSKLECYHRVHAPAPSNQSTTIFPNNFPNVFRRNRTWKRSNSFSYQWLQGLSLHIYCSKLFNKFPSFHRRTCFL